MMTDRSFGYVPDPEHRLASFRSKSTASLPTGAPLSANLLAWSPRVYDQGRESSCTGQVAKRLCDMALRAKGRKEETSALFPYANGRALEWGRDAIQNDLGAYISSVMESLVTIGNVSYSDFATGQEFMNIDEVPGTNFFCSADVVPFATLYEDAYSRRVKATDWVRIFETGEDRLHAIENMVGGNGLPVGFGGPVSRAYCDFRGGMPYIDPSDGPPVGMHAQTIVGYSNPDCLMLVANSWGESFGGGDGGGEMTFPAPRGFVWVPYSYFLREDVRDFSAILGLEM